MQYFLFLKETLQTNKSKFRMKKIYPHCPHKVYHREEIPYSLPLTFFDTRISLAKAKGNLLWDRITLEGQTNTDLAHGTLKGVNVFVVPCQVVLVCVEEAIEFTRFCFNRTFSPFVIDASGNNVDLSGWTELYRKGEKGTLFVFAPYDSIAGLLFDYVTNRDEMAQLLLNVPMRRLLIAATQNRLSAFMDCLHNSGKESALFQVMDTLKLYSVLQVFSCHADSFHYVLEAMEHDKGLWISVKEPMLIWLEHLKTFTPSFDGKNRLIIQEIAERINNLSSCTEGDE